MLCNRIRSSDTVDVNAIHVSMPSGGKGNKRSELNLAKHIQKKTTTTTTKIISISATIDYLQVICYTRICYRLVMVENLKKPQGLIKLGNQKLRI